MGGFWKAPIGQETQGVSLFIPQAFSHHPGLITTGSDGKGLTRISQKGCLKYSITAGSWGFPFLYWEKRRNLRDNVPSLVVSSKCLPDEYPVIHTYTQQKRRGGGRGKGRESVAMKEKWSKGREREWAIKTMSTSACSVFTWVILLQNMLNAVPTTMWRVWGLLFDWNSSWFCHEAAGWSLL